MQLTISRDSLPDPLIHDLTNTFRNVCLKIEGYNTGEISIYLRAPKNQMQISSEEGKALMHLLQAIYTNK